LIFRNATIYDGSGADPATGDVAVSNGRIAAIGALASMPADREIDAAGKALSPGFIDVHTHDDRYVLEQPAVPTKASQGVTSVVIGNCGFSMAPYTRPGIDQHDWFVNSEDTKFGTIAEFHERLRKTPPALNVATLVGHNTLRMNCVAEIDKPASDRQIAAMQAQMREAMDAGATGMSSGLFYPPGRAAPTSEVVAVASAMGGKGLYTAHIRDERESVLDAMEEAAFIAREAKVKLILSHHKTAGRTNFGRTRETLPLIERLQAGQPLGLDVYPYTASSTVLLPDYVESADRVTITWCRGRPEFSGRDIDEVGRELGLTTRKEVVAAVSPAGAIYFQMDEADVQRVLAFPRAMVGSDGLPWDSVPHPRLWGTFPRVLGHYARDIKLLTMQDAIHRMTGLPAAEFGFKERGLIRDGHAADLVLFDPATIIDTATFEKPEQAAAGIEIVVNNGVPIWDGGKPTGARPGIPLQP
ncbi:MAG: amidohydrolase family protein, partial [Reyranellaceae bacterium]